MDWSRIKKQSTVIKIHLTRRLRLYLYSPLNHGEVFRGLIIIQRKLNGLSLPIYFHHIQVLLRQRYLRYSLSRAYAVITILSHTRKYSKNITFKYDLQLIRHDLECADAALVLRYYVLFVPRSTGELKKVVTRICC